VKGAGTYELRDWTLFLTYDDGKAWPTDFSTLGRDPKNHTSLLFGVFAARREQRWSRRRPRLLEGGSRTLLGGGWALRDSNP
jgi:hypothetical protein